MAHDESTADCFDYLEQGRTRVVRSAKVVRQLWRKSGRASSSSEEESEHESGSESEEGDIVPPTPTKIPIKPGKPGPS